MPLQRVLWHFLPGGAVHACFSYLAEDDSPELRNLNLIFIQIMKKNQMLPSPHHLNLSKSEELDRGIALQDLSRN
jgi:hypothetical protein